MAGGVSSCTWPNPIPLDCRTKGALCGVAGGVGFSNRHSLVVGEWGGVRRPLSSDVAEYSALTLGERDNPEVNRFKSQKQRSQ